MTQKKLKNQLNKVKKWLERARPPLEEQYLGSGNGVFLLLVALEQLVIYLEMQNDETQTK